MTRLQNIKSKYHKNQSFFEKICSGKGEESDSVALGKMPGVSRRILENAILYVTENGCKWRALPKSYGNWHTVYVRMNRWSKNGVLQRLFEGLQRENIIKVNLEAVCLDSASIKVHPHGTGALRAYQLIN